MKRYDTVVIGAGVTGSAVARELSRRKGRFLVLEKASDVCEGTSKANSAIIHAGFDAQPGSLKARMNVRGNLMMDKLSEELDIPFRRVGALVVCLREEELPRLRELQERGRENGVEGLELLSGEQARALEPNLSKEVCGALLAKTSGIICPFALTLGLAESAAKNGVEFRFDTEVTGLSPEEGGWVLQAGGEEVHTRTVVNAAGVHAGLLHNMVCEQKLAVIPRKGEYCLLDKTAGGHVGRTIFQLPGRLGKGVLVSPTVHGNLLLGPTAADVEDPDSTATTAAGLTEVMEKSAWGVKDIPYRQVITSFMGLRAHEAGDDFVLAESAPGFFDGAGIESPGLSSAPAIGEYLAGLVTDKLGLEENPDFDPIRRGAPRIAELPLEERAAKIAENPLYGNIICRCEEVSEGEILDAIHGILGARTLDGVKRRTRAGMGRCQSGFCSPRVMEILARELRLDLTEIRKNGGDSQIVLKKTRGEREA
ncbi:FAD/NAD(P)-binding oxidoreductase [Acutalibacter sp. 1XD8-33]|uniref:NAD(P)/FAD-dependent oxidoreductase n=1 Tax=Acutalibacter sp. 1XD8-33 TaxID=2320081 RepID=UPI000EA33A1A|nr:NAD(P)/FAD-dependent oxidoreductase [Acutalibacter sp. 1XD8-33]RKJ40615.1 FAD/NAD(P)-binding oxidoreductase [Acutalibacter sp. 1XD8-33]